MSIGSISTTLAGFLVMGASTAAGAVIWLVLTAPERVPGVIDGQAGAVQIVVQALYAMMAHIVRYL